MIHVLHVVPMLRVGGMELALARVVRGLPPPHFKHSVACLTGTPSIADEFAPTVPIYCLNGESGAFSQLMRLRHLIRDTRPSLIHARNLSAGLDVAITRVTLKARPPLVLSFHGTDTVAQPSRRWRVMAAITARSATRLFTVSKPSREFLARSLGLPRSRIDIIANGVDTTRFVPNAGNGGRHDRVIIGTVGNLSAVKNQRLLVRACAALTASGYAVELRIAGEGREREGISRLAESLGISRSVHLLGHVPDVRSFLQALDMFVLPSDSEAHPNALIEAMACGLPCIASRVGGIPDVLVDDNVGRLIERGDLAGLVGVMTELIVSPETRAALGRGARKQVGEHYSLDQMIRRYADLYSEVAFR